ncbi:hypothetical protein ACFV7R_15445 [Streptomyces sp. NPDC059866]|uniref:hypothetical protein n=1 Tax=Streptomyces sp. NPDC059866 TaxID=3346978 RepID=UPI0036558DD6
MIWSAALSGAAVRVLRAAAGRRALQTVLLVGGLFVLGVLYGGQARATDGTASATSAISPASVTVSASASVDPPGSVDPSASVTSAKARPDDVVKSTSAEGAASLAQGLVGGTDHGFGGSQDPADRGGAPLTDVSPGPVGRPAAEAPHGRDSESIVRPVTEDLVGSVGERVTRPVGGVVETVTAQAEVPPLSSLPVLPSLPGLPGLSDSPTLPVLPELPGLPEPPGYLPAPPALPGLPGQFPPLPGAVTPQPGVAGTSPSPEAGSEGRGGKAGVDGVHGPRLGGSSGEVVAAVHGSGQHDRAGGQYAPVHQVPAGRGDGMLGNRSAADSSTSRHGDTHAVTSNHRARLRLVPGAAVRVESDGTRDRHRDIPVFPG